MAGASPATMEMNGGKGEEMEDKSTQQEYKGAELNKLITPLPS